MPVILDFCGECGILQPEGKGLDEKTACENCGFDLKDRNNRIQGTFEASEAEKFTTIVFGPLS